MLWVYFFFNMQHVEIGTDNISSDITDFQVSQFCKHKVTSTDNDSVICIKCMSGITFLIQSFVRA